MVTTMQSAPATERGTTSSLISSDRVEGTAVYDVQGTSASGRLSG